VGSFVCIVSVQVCTFTVVIISILYLRTYVTRIVKM